MSEQSVINNVISGKFRRCQVELQIENNRVEKFFFPHIDTGLPFFLETNLLPHNYVQLMWFIV